MKGREASEAAKTLAALLPRLADTMPSWCWWDVELDEVSMQAKTLAEVHELMALFPGVVWKKQYHKYESWWSYRTEFDGVKLHIEEKVPVTYETRTVTKQVAVITCDDEEVIP